MGTRDWIQEGKNFFVDVLYKGGIIVASRSDYPVKKGHIVIMRPTSGICGFEVCWMSQEPVSQYSDFKLAMLRFVRLVLSPLSR
ncbi:MAG: hypothetical protein A3H02_00880 [Candidatus Niyogibacteria bacterium RIFCSPLOWO2_12_FULL_41_13]|uniref:Uncharacterized protein n=1 Tax=Candidatus Niyogibacteria bacterium RIFCSPLOWO2_12_FULL_41_13 TaxID=1801726 RepID=A0A1G2F2N3_9BACT|nr:MAG: hypothetical protein A3H02_00880 [Candidatus Niyogibacteria bacterium RIFCSPLOWO2_12_FULL_41_13]